MAPRSKLQLSRTLGRPVALVLIVLLAQVFLAGRNQGGCGSEDAQDTWQSKVQALGTIYQDPDANIEAELVLISTISKDHAFIDSATDVYLAVDGKRIALQKDATRSGRWSVTNAQAVDLTLTDTTRYQFGFELDDAELAGDDAGALFRGEVTGYDSPSVMTLATEKAYVGYSMDIEIAPALTGERKGVLFVYGPDGDVTWHNFDTDQPQFDGSKHAELIAGREHTLPAEAFPVAGAYRLVLYTMRYAAGFDQHISADLGVFSGFMAGSSEELIVNVE